MTSIKQLLLILPLLFVLNVLTAQNATVKGVVTEKQNGLPLEFASVAVLKLSDSTIAGGALTQNNCAFAIPKINIGNYLLKVVAVGYQTSYARFEILHKSQQLTLDSIYLDISGKMLKDVIVEGRKNTITNKLDKQTYKADQFESAKGGTATDVLKNLPSVAVNSAGEISVRGSTGFLVLINGKPVLTDAQTILSQLPANTIENIELITAPSAKYDADGKAGIINITTKKGTTDGIALQANVLAGLPSTTAYNNLEKPVRFGGDITLSFKKNKWDISVSGNYTRNDANGSREGDVFTNNFTNNTITRFPSNGERSFDRYNYGARTAITYSAGKNDVLSAGFYAGKKYQQRRADIVYNNSTASLSTGTVIRQLTYFNSNLQNKEGNFVLGSLDYAHTFKNNSKLSASAIYENADLYGNTVNINLDPHSRTPHGLCEAVTLPALNVLQVIPSNRQ